MDLIGEISLMKDLTRTMDITMQEGAEEEEFPGEEQARQESIADEQRRAAAAGAGPAEVVPTGTVSAAALSVTRLRLKSSTTYWAWRTCC